MVEEEFEDEGAEGRVGEGVGGFGEHAFHGVEVGLRKIVVSQVVVRQ